MAEEHEDSMSRLCVCKSEMATEYSGPESVMSECGLLVGNGKLKRMDMRAV